MSRSPARVATSTITADTDFIIDKTMMEYWRYTVVYVDHGIKVAAGLEGAENSEPDKWQNWVDVHDMLKQLVDMQSLLTRFNDVGPLMCSNTHTEWRSLISNISAADIGYRLRPVLLNFVDAIRSAPDANNQYCMRTRFPDTRTVHFRPGDKNRLFALLNAQWQIDTTEFGSTLSEHVDLSLHGEPWLEYEYILDTLDELEELRDAIYDFHHRIVSMESTPEDINEWTGVIDEIGCASKDKFSAASSIERLLEICKISANDDWLQAVV